MVKLKYRAVDVVKELMEVEGKTNIELAEHLGVTRQAVTSLFKAKNDLKCNVFVDILDWLGYELRVSKKE